MTASERLADSSNSSFEAELDAMRSCAHAMESLPEDARQRTLGWLIEKYGSDMSFGQGREASTGFPGGGSSTGSGTPVRQPELSVKRFVQDKAPRTDVERISVLAYYLTHHRGIQHFKTADLTTLNTEAAQPKFSNAANAASNAVKSSGFLADAGKGMRQLTVKGEEAVEALPDRAAFKAAMEKYASSRRRRPSRTSRAKTED